MIASIGRDRGTTFALVLMGGDDEYTERGQAFLDRLREIEDLGARQRDQVAISIARQGDVDDETLATVDRILSSPEDFQRTAFSRGLEDSTGNGLLDGEERAFDLDPEERNPAFDEVADPLVAGGYDANEVAYLEHVGLYWHHRNNRYGRWQQAEELGLLTDATEDGSVSDEELRGVWNDDTDRLINAKEREIGTDPESADTSGDGFEDHLKWGPMADAGMDVEPTRIDVFVEVDKTEGASFLTDEERREITSTFETEPDDDVGSIHLHFHRSDGDLERADDYDEVDEHYREHHETEGLGYRYLLVTDGSIEDSGRARYSTHGPNWMVVRDDLGDGKRRTTAHEIGHALGVHSDDFEGVDTDEEIAGYDSIMNYEYGDYDDVTFSNGAPFDDYEHMLEDSFAMRFISTSELRSAWNDGAVDETVETTSAPTATPSPTPTPSVTPTPSPTPTPAPTTTSTPSATETPTPTASSTPTPAATETPTPTDTNTPTATQTASPSPTPTATAPSTPTATPTGTQQSTGGTVLGVLLLVSLLGRRLGMGSRD